ncbi:hypothetical protein FGG08_006931 [Glutinoglossum americanum]|uniref:Peptidase A1 domain-containing protein n=1 Tax=Glutinoglossum americanum TaxID=1670608 RepID=A0A9P8KZV6_9PEZI|nr:hypothetical protein FGG08_006931 [Glutinoglossum americanum]
MSTSETWVVVPEGCTINDPTNCPASRGQLFNSADSSTWQTQPPYSLKLGSNLGYSDGEAIYGNDIVELGCQGEGPKLTQQIVAGVASKEFYLGLFGISPSPINFTDPNPPRSSFLLGLKQNGTIPRLNGVPASLTLGGYDISRLIPNSLTFPFSDDISRGLEVGVQSVTMSSGGKSDTSLLPSPINASIDSTVPHLWLPMEACAKFESAFGLTWNEEAKLYFIDENLHHSLVSQNASVKFKLGVTPKGGKTVDIVLPYAAFDLKASYPLVRHTARYFPLKRAANNTQYTLGRAFLQEAYLTVDYERLNFSVSQSVFTNSSQQTLITIPPLNNSTSFPFESSGNHLSMGALAGIAIGAIGLIGMLTFYFCVHRHHQYGEDMDFALSGRIREEQAPKFEQGGSPATHRTDTESDPRILLHVDTRIVEVSPAADRPIYETATVNARGPKARLGQVKEENEDNASNFI